MGALDAWFATEPLDPDSPDPSTDGLLDLVDVAVADVRTWTQAALDALEAWAVPDANDVDPGRLAFESALERNFRLGSEPAVRDYHINMALVPIGRAVLQLLDGVVNFDAHDRAEFMAHSRTYEPVNQIPGLGIGVAPPFRNTLDDVARAGELHRILAHYAYPQARIRGWPGTVRYGGLTAVQQVGNAVAHAAFAYEIHTGFEATFRPEPIWY